MNKKRVERVVKIVVYAIGVNTIVIYKQHNYRHWSWDEIFDENFWPIVVFSLIACYIGTCYLEYKEDEDKKKNKKWDKWKDETDDSTNDGTDDKVDDDADNEES